tara:strand:- start:124 stop:1326 length:1203 start_codon:yes stop_codon:yes gene_type:complete
MEYLLDDLTVIDAATFLAGPGAATILGDFGANVIKIEPPSGDTYRTLVGRYPVPYHWLLTSRNKRSLAIDLTKDAGQLVLHKLLLSADVLTTNFLPKQLKRYQLEYERVKTINPRLVYAHISGYGLEGPDVEKRAFDITAWWARSGLMEFVRDPGQRPLQSAPGMGDHSTAVSMFGSIMTGLYRRERTGAGCYVSTSLAATGTWANGMALQGVIAGNDLGKYRQERDWIDPFMASYCCKDERWIVLASMVPMKEWPKICNALGHPEWTEDARFESFKAIRDHRNELVELLSGAIGTFKLSELQQAFDQCGVTWGPVQPMGEVIHDPQLRAAEIVIETGSDDATYPLTIASPINVREAPKRKPQKAPEIGQDSVAILAEHGFAEDDIRELVSAGIVVTAAK